MAKNTCSPRYTRRVIIDSKDFNIIDNKDEKNPVKTGIIGRSYTKDKKNYFIKYIYEDQEYLKFNDVAKVYEEKIDSLTKEKVDA